MSDFLNVANLHKSYQTQKILENISFSAREGEFLSLLGPSGCGKTTLLRCLMGLEKPDEGTILYEGNNITEQRPDKRGFTIVFQDYSLFPHMTVFQNIAYPLKLKKNPPAEIKQRVMTALEALHIPDAAKKYPHQLSGGMKQRVAIARSLVMNSKVMLMDEPFSALDAMVKVELSDLLKQIQNDYQITMIMVTHDQLDAVLLSDRILLMNHGRIIADDTPAALYHRNDDPFVFEFFTDQINKREKNIDLLRKDL